ncbi:transcriptional regulator yidN Cro/CI family [Vibrio astriarenae]|nr:transcriptional regulator yidN Cro/CI family [Vibrio sp. C7]
MRYNAQVRVEGLTKVSETQFKSEIAKRLKSVRQQKSLSLDATSKLTGVSKAMLGQIEREESNPTISTLWKIASGLETSFSAFFATDPSLQESAMTFPDDPKMQVKTLFPFQSDTGIEVFEITLNDFHQQDSTPHEHGVVEHIHVIEGELALKCGEDWHQLLSGDSHRFFADQNHAYKASSESVVFHCIISYPHK